MNRYEREAREWDIVGILDDVADFGAICSESICGVEVATGYFDNASAKGTGAYDNYELADEGFEEFEDLWDDDELMAIA